MSIIALSPNAIGSIEEQLGKWVVLVHHMRQLVKQDRIGAVCTGVLVPPQCLTRGGVVGKVHLEEPRRLASRWKETSKTVEQLALDLENGDSWCMRDWVHCRTKGSK